MMYNWPRPLAFVRTLALMLALEFAALGAFSYFVEASVDFTQTLNWLMLPNVPPNHVDRVPITDQFTALYAKGKGMIYVITVRPSPHQTLTPITYSEGRDDGKWQYSAWFTSQDKSNWDSSADPKEKRMLGGSYSVQMEKEPAVCTSYVVRVVVPFWIPTTLFLVFPVLYTMVTVARARTRRLHNRCVSCGYDLRATPDRCPECGFIPVKSLGLLPAITAPSSSRLPPAKIVGVKFSSSNG